MTEAFTLGQPAESFGVHRFKELDATRGLASLMVCLSHGLAILWIPHKFNGLAKICHAIFYHILDGAAIVDYFFVLSGFVLALPFVYGKHRPIVASNFVLRRILRIMPTYWCGLAFALLLRSIAAPYVVNSSDALVDWSQPVPTGQILSHIMLIFGSPNVTLIDGPIWSLNVEMQISLLLPLVIAALHIRQTPVGSLTVLLITCYMALKFTNLGALPFLPLFVVGVLLARYQKNLVAAIKELGGVTLSLILFMACGYFGIDHCRVIGTIQILGQIG